MAASPPAAPPRPRLATLGQVLAIAVASLSLAGTIFGVVLYFVSNEVTDQLRHAVGTDTIETDVAALGVALERFEGRLDTLDNRLDGIGRNLRQLNGEDRVIEVLDGSAFAEEPVYPGENIALRWTVRRTDLGAACHAEGATPIFVALDGIPRPGQLVTPIVQFGTEFLPRRVVVAALDPLTPGRVSAHVEVRYRCGQETVYDELPRVVFEVLAGPPPPR